MTAGGGILHIETPSEALVRSGGVFHGLQLWVNLPAKDKWVEPRYQNLEGRQAALVSSADGGALVRIVAGDVGGHRGPGDTHTPITYLHASVSAGARLYLPWRPDFNALVYVLSGTGTVGPKADRVRGGQLAVFGAGDHLSIKADDQLDVIVLGGRPIGEPVAWYGPFVMNTKAELQQAMDDYRAGRLGVIPPNALMPHVYRR
jgi:redox-sensitive bicupin YhaK (pirin superfamily)